MIIWITGLPGSGKTTLAEKIKNKNFVFLKENFKNETLLKLIDQKVKQIPLIDIEEPISLLVNL